MLAVAAPLLGGEAPFVLAVLPGHVQTAEDDFVLLNLASQWQAAASVFDPERIWRHEGAEARSGLSLSVMAGAHTASVAFESFRLSLP